MHLARSFSSTFLSLSTSPVAVDPEHVALASLRKKKEKEKEITLLQLPGHPYPFSHRVLINLLSFHSSNTYLSKRSVCGCPFKFRIMSREGKDNGCLDWKHGTQLEALQLWQAGTAAKESRTGAGRRTSPQQGENTGTGGNGLGISVQSAFQGSRQIGQRGNQQGHQQQRSQQQNR